MQHHCVDEQQIIQLAIVFIQQKELPPSYCINQNIIIIPAIYLLEKGQFQRVCFCVLQVWII